MYPLKFEPILKQTLRGGDKITPLKHLKDDLKGMGESWEISGVENNKSVVANGLDKSLTPTDMVKKYREELVGEANYARLGNEFPLLIKFIDAKQDLSVQVYPTDELVKKRHNSKGKTEMWYVTGAGRGAKLCSGFPKRITPKEYKECVYNNTAADVLQEYEIHPGDVLFLPVERIHSTGAGAPITEIQQVSDITYRIYDFNCKNANGKTRELYTSQVLDVISYEVLDDYRTKYELLKDEPVESVACPYFITSVYDISEQISYGYSELDSFVISACIGGSCLATDNEGNGVTLGAGETILLPATTQDVTIVPQDGNVKLLETYV